MTSIDERYKRGKIYTIRCKYDDSLIYVGSTIQPLSVRMGAHRSIKEKKVSSLADKVCGDWDNWYIELYENYPCNSKQELEKREGQVIREIGTINRCILGRTVKEYHQDNREKITEYVKKYRQDNRGKITEYYKKYRETLKEKKITCECGCEIRKDIIKRHKKTKKHQSLMLNILEK